LNELSEMIFDSLLIAVGLGLTMAQSGRGWRVSAFYRAGCVSFEIGLASGLNPIIVPPEMMLLEMPLMILLGVLLLVVIWL